MPTADFVEPERLPVQRIEAHGGGQKRKQKQGDGCCAAKVCAKRGEVPQGARKLS